MTTYDKDIFADSYPIGGHGGQEFIWLHGMDGALVAKLEVWAGEKALRGIRVTATNGDYKLFGKDEESYSVHQFKPLERVTALSIWGDGKGTRCGAFKIETTEGEFWPRMTKKKLRDEYKMGYGSGFLAGLYGRHGNDIDNLGFIFLNSIASATLVNVKYPSLEEKLVATTPFEIARLVMDNLNGSISQESILTGERKFTSTQAWSTTTALEMAVTTTVKAGVPKVSEASVQTKLSISEQFTFSRSKSEETLKRVSHTVTCPAHTKLTATAVTYEDSLDVPYDAELVVERPNGTKFSYPVSGRYKGVTVRSIFISYVEEDNKGNIKKRAEVV